METISGPIKPFVVSKLPKEKYDDVNELAKDIADVLAIDQEQIVINLISSSDIKGDQGEKGDKGNKGDKGDPGTIGLTGPTGPIGPGLVWEGAWDVLAVQYEENDIVSHNNVLYICTDMHNSDATTEPGVGVDWADVWDVFYVQTVPLIGVVDGSDAAVGEVGEILSSLVAVGAAVALTTATNADVTTLALTAGDWDVEAIVHFAAAAATVTDLVAGIHTTTLTLPADGSEGYSGIQSTTTSFNDSITLTRKRFDLAAPDTISLVARAVFSAGSVGAFGQITARRVR